MPPKKLPASKKGGRGSRGGKYNSGAHRGNGSCRDSGSQQSGTRESSDSTNEQANDLKTIADSNWFQAAWRRAGHIEKDRSKLYNNI
jgi:hypothetical protein